MYDPLIQDNHRPIVVADSRLQAGDASARVRGDDPEAVLRQYLRLIRRVRKQQRDRTIALRRVDLAALGSHLEWSDDQVLSRLADLMGSTRRQRSTMAAALATGASLITVAGSSAAAPPEPRPGTPTVDRDPVVVVADHLAPTTSVAKREHAARLVLPDTRAVRGDARTDGAAVNRGNDLAQDSDDPAPADPPAVAPPDGPTDDPPPATTVQPPREDPPQDATANAPEPEEPTDESAVDEPSGNQPDPAGNELATDAAASDDPVVAVGEPPVPPATDQDGNLVAVGEPPIPPTSDAADAPEPPPEDPEPG